MRVPRRLVLPALLVLASPAWPDVDDQDHDHERAREALRRSEVLPLADILVVVEERFGGRVIEVEFEREHGRYLYELELVTPSGRLLELDVDAATGAVLKEEAEREDD